jgi:hypothetical protein
VRSCSEELLNGACIVCQEFIHERHVCIELHGCCTEQENCCVSHLFAEAKICNNETQQRLVLPARNHFEGPNAFIPCFVFKLFSQQTGIRASCSHKRVCKRHELDFLQLTSSSVDFNCSFPLVTNQRIYFAAWCGSCTLQWDHQSLMDKPAVPHR